MIRRNVASQPIILGPLLAVADGSAQTSGAAITHRANGSSTAGAGTLTHITDGCWEYIPTQAETNFVTFGLVLTKSGSTAVPVTIVTTLLDTQDNMRAGLTALPNVTFNSSNGLATYDRQTTIINYIDTEIAAILAAVDTEVASILTAVGGIGSDTSGVTTLLARLSSARAGYLDNLSAGAAALQSTLNTVSTNVNTITGYVDTEVAAILAAVDTEVASILTVANNLATALELNAGNYRFTPAALANAPSGGGGGGDTPGTTTLLSRLTATRAGYLDNLSAGAVAQQSTLNTVAGYIDTEVAAILAAVDTEIASILTAVGGIGSDTAGVTTLLTRLSSARAGYLDNLSGGAVALQSTLATVGTNVTAILAAVDTEIATIISRIDSIKASTDALATAMEVDGSVSRFTINALEQAPVGGGGAGSGNPQVETGWSLTDCMKLVTAFLFGKTNGGGTNTIEYRDINDTKVRLRMTIDQNSNRLIVIKDVS